MLHQWAEIYKKINENCCTQQVENLFSSFSNLSSTYSKIFVILTLLHANKLHFSLISAEYERILFETS